MGKSSNRSNDLEVSQSVSQSTNSDVLINLFAVHPPTGPTLKHFLYSYLKDQPIWQSLRFWNAAFFDAVQYERARRPVPTR